MILINKNNSSLRIKINSYLLNSSPAVSMYKKLLTAASDDNLFFVNYNNIYVTYISNIYTYVHKNELLTYYNFLKNGEDYSLLIENDEEYIFGDEINYSNGILVAINNIKSEQINLNSYKISFSVYLQNVNGYLTTITPPSPIEFNNIINIQMQKEIKTPIQLFNSYIYFCNYLNNINTYTITAMFTNSYTKYLRYYVYTQHGFLNCLLKSNIQANKIHILSYVEQSKNLSFTLCNIQCLLK